MSTLYTQTQPFSYRNSLFQDKKNNGPTTFVEPFKQAIKNHPEEAKQISNAQKWAIPLLKNPFSYTNEWQCLPSDTKHHAIQFRKTTELEILITLRQICRGGLKNVKLKLWLTQKRKSKLLVNYRMLKVSELFKSALPSGILEKNAFLFNKLYKKHYCEHISYLSGKEKKERLLGSYFPMTLDQLIMKRPLSDKEIIDIAYQIAQDINNLHTHMWCHLDIKPSNICLTTGLSPVLIDFDFASEVNSPQQKKGTIGYMPPEFFPYSGKYIITPSIDMWSFGTTLLKMTNPFLYNNLRAAQLEVTHVKKPNIFTDKLSEIHESLKEFPQPIDEIIVALTQVHPNDRLNASNLVKKLEKLKI